MFGGTADQDEANEYDGTSWTEGGNLSTGRYGLAGAGLQTAALAVGGNIPPHAANVEEYNGTSWTEVNDLPAAKINFSGAGTQAAAIVFGGQPGDKTVSLLYDGTNWATTSNLATGRTQLGSAGTGSLALCIGGKSTTAATEEFTEIAANTQSLDVS